MRKEFSFGGIIYRLERGELFFLLVFSNRNRVWGFPKGHAEKGESEQETALREIKEETGLEAIKKIAGFRQEDVYKAISHRQGSKGLLIEKHSTYFLYYTKEKDVDFDEGEIGDFKWVKAKGAYSLIIFPNLKKILRKACGIIEARQARLRRHL